MIDFLMSFSAEFYATLVFTVVFIGFTGLVSQANTDMMYDRINGTDAYDGEIFDDIGVSLNERIAKAGK